MSSNHQDISCDGLPIPDDRFVGVEPMGYSADEACDVAADTGSRTSPDYGPTGTRLTAIAWVRLAIGEDDHNDLVTSEDKFKIAMARQ